MSFPHRLEAAVRDKQTPAMVGIDPVWDLLPPTIRNDAIHEHGKTLAAVAAAYRQFCGTVIELVAPLVPIVKFQLAFFEAVGPAGLQVLADLAALARQRGLLTIFDGKRNDIGSTAAAYAQGYLNGWNLGDERVFAWQADALTVNPYLGADGIAPFVDAAARGNAGIFVLVRTSNPGASMLQELRLADQTVFERVADAVEAWNLEYAPSDRHGPVGAVVGATAPEQLTQLRQRMPHALLLIPGYGAQGGNAADVAGGFDSDGLGAVVNSSRGILYAYRESRYAGSDWTDAVVAATQSMIADLATNTPAGRLRE